MLNHTSKLVRSIRANWTRLFGARQQPFRHRRQLEFDILEERTVPSTYQVNLVSDGLGQGTLRAAIIAANNNPAIDTIQIALPKNPQQPYALTTKNGVSGQENDAKLGDLDLKSTNPHLVIQGQLIGGAKPIIDASEMNDRIIQVFKGVHVEFRNLILTGGRANDNGDPGVMQGTTTARGGAIFNDDGIVKLTNVVLQVNGAHGRDGVKPGANGQSGEGGGIYSRNGEVTLIGVTLKNNFAQGGNGGVGFEAPAFDANGIFGAAGAGGHGGSGEGGGIFATNTVLRISSDSLFQTNTAAGGLGGGGGVDTFPQGAAGTGGEGGSAAGGAISMSGPDAKIEQTRMVANAAIAGFGGPGGDGAAGGNGGKGGSAEGGGIFFDCGLVLTNVLLKNNFATGRPGGNGGNATPIVLPDDADDDDTADVFAEGGRAGKGGDGGVGGLAFGGALACTDANSITTMSQTEISFNSAAAGAGGIGGKGGDPGNSYFNGPGGNGGKGGDAKGGALFTLCQLVEPETIKITHNTASAGAGGAGSNGGNGGGRDGIAYDTFNSGGKGGLGGDAQGGGIWSFGTEANGDVAHLDFNSAFAGNGGNGGNGGLSDFVGSFAGDGGQGGNAQGGAFWGNSSTFNIHHLSVASNQVVAGDGGAGGAAGPAGDFRYPNYPSADGGMGGVAQGGGMWTFNELVQLDVAQFVSNRAVGGKGGAGGDGAAGVQDFILLIGELGGDGGNAGPGGPAQGGGLWSFGSISAGLTTFDRNNVLGGNGGRGGHGGPSGSGPSGALPAGNGGAAGNGGTVQGGGIYVSGGEFDLSHSTLSRNGLAPGRGGQGGAGGNSGAFPGSDTGAGGVGAPGGSGGVGQGAGLFNDASDTLMDNVTISSNFVVDSFGGSGGPGGLGVEAAQNGPGGTTGSAGVLQGGGTLVTRGNTSVGNTTIAFNMLFGPMSQGGGVFCLLMQDKQAATFDAFNTLIADNTAAAAPDFQGHFSANSRKVLLGFNDGSNLPFDGVLVGSIAKGQVDPRLGLLQDNGGPNKLETHALLTPTPASPGQPNSPAINAGDNQFSSGETDERGLPRIVGKSVDIGAFELQQRFLPVPGQPGGGTHQKPGGPHPAKIILHFATSAILPAVELKSWRF